MPIEIRELVVRGAVSPGERPTTASGDGPGEPPAPALAEEIVDRLLAQVLERLQERQER